VTATRAKVIVRSVVLDAVDGDLIDINRILAGAGTNSFVRAEHHLNASDVPLLATSGRIGRDTPLIGARRPPDQGKHACAVTC
jgi:hypothetical protein